MSKGSSSCRGRPGGHADSGARNPAVPSHTPALQALEEAARTLQVQLQPVVARSGAALEEAFAAMARGHAQAMVVLGFGPYIAARQRLAEVALRYRLPTVFVAAGARGGGRPDELRPECRG